MFFTYAMFLSGVGHALAEKQAALHPVLQPQRKRGRPSLRDVAPSVASGMLSLDDALKVQAVDSESTFFVYQYIKALLSFAFAATFLSLRRKLYMECSHRTTHKN